MPVSAAFTRAATVALLHVTASQLPSSFLEDAARTFDRVGPELQRSFHRELEGTLPVVEGLDAEAAKLQRIQDLLEPLYEAMPKNGHGYFGPAATRYALHRYFSREHGWFIRGLEPEGDGWNVTQPASILQDGLSEAVTAAYERHLGGLGLSLADLAVLARSFERLIHEEAAWRLRAVYTAHDFPMDQGLDEDVVADAVDTYMASYILGIDLSRVGRKQALELARKANTAYKNWESTQVFLRDVRREVSPDGELLTFEGVVRVVEAISERYGRWQNHECHAIKGELLSLGSAEDVAQGRVRLSDFYGSALHHGKWQFGESVHYLRQLGALDESDPTALRVVVPNYIQSPTNCLSSSDYYSVCCLDDCEELLGALELQLQAPEASAAQIAALAGALHSASQPANRSLPLSLLRRLEEIEDVHGGVVPLHGRLFAQWLHHAFPQECAFPHVSGTTRPLRAERFEDETGLLAGASKDEMRQFTEDAKKSRKARTAEPPSAPWSEEEELFVPRQPPRRRSATTVPAARVAAGVLVLVSGTVAVLRTLMPITEACAVAVPGCVSGRKSHLV